MRRAWCRVVVLLVALGLSSCADDATVSSRDGVAELTWGDDLSVSLDMRPAMTAADSDLLVVNSARWNDPDAPDFGLRRSDGRWSNPPDLPVRFNAVALATSDGHAIVAVASCRTDDCSFSDEEQLRLEFWTLEEQTEWRRVATGPSFSEEVEIGALPGDHARALFFVGGRQYLVAPNGDVTTRSNQPASPGGSAVVCLLDHEVLTVDLARSDTRGADGSLRWQPTSVRTTGFDDFGGEGRSGSVPSGVVPGIEYAHCGPSGLLSLADGRETSYDVSSDIWTERVVPTGAAKLSEAIYPSGSVVVGVDAVSSNLMERAADDTWTTRSEQAVQLVQVGGLVLVQTTDSNLREMET